jgi:hypothetical protein
MKKIVKITPIGKRDVYDISVANAEHYVLENGVVTHNTGPMYSANTVFIIGKSQEKDGTDIVGWNFTINIEKSRFVKEKSKLPFLVTYDSGINKWSGLLDIALNLGAVKKPSNGWYSRVNLDTGEIEDKKWRAADTNSKDFWMPMLTNKTFYNSVKDLYQVSNHNLISDDEIEKELALLEDDLGEDDD